MSVSGAWDRRRCCSRDALLTRAAPAHQEGLCATATRLRASPSHLDNLGASVLVHRSASAAREPRPLHAVVTWPLKEPR